MAEVWVRESRMFLSGSLRYNDKIANTYSKKLKSFKSTSMSPYLSHAINQMILDLFMIMCECMQHLSPIFFIWKKRTPMTYRAYVYQFNKHLLTNHNKGIVLLIGLRNWRPRRQWNPCSIFVRAIHTGYRKLSNLTVYWELQRLFLDQLIVYKDFVKIFHDFRLSNPQ